MEAPDELITAWWSHANVIDVNTWDVPFLEGRTARVTREPGERPGTYVYVAETLLSPVDPPVRCSSSKGPIPALEALYRKL